MADIFISYASEDRSKAEQIAKALEEYGWSVWWDRIIPPGKTFDQVIEEAINDASCVVVLWSKKSIKSDWVKEEANVGKERKILVPAKIDPVNLPLGFGRIQAADLTDWKAEKEHPEFLRFRNAISEVAGSPSAKNKSGPDTRLPESNLQQQEEVKSERSENFQPDPRNFKSGTMELPIISTKSSRKKRRFVGIGAVALILVLIVIALFSYSSNTIIVTSGPNGSISPSGEIEVNRSDSVDFTITPNPGYRISDVKIDGSSVEVKPSQIIEDVTSDRTIEATFEPQSYIIMASVGPNGNISPKGSVPLTYGNGVDFKIEPNQGYRIADVKVDERSVGTPGSYPFKNIKKNHTIEASFSKITNTITPSSGPNGSISPSGKVEVNSGGSVDFSIKPNPGYRIADVKVDDRSVGAKATHIFENITSNHTISASFKQLPPYERFAFNPKNQHIVIQNGKIPNPNNKITLEAWFKANAFSETQWIIFKPPDVLNRQPYYQYALGFRQDKKGIYFPLGIEKKREWIDEAFRNNLRLNEWHHVAATYDGKRMSLYLDGKKWNNNPEKRGKIWAYKTNLVIGGMIDKGNLIQQFQGELAEVRIWEVARSADQISAAMYKTIPPDEKGLLWSSTNWLSW